MNKNTIMAINIDTFFIIIFILLNILNQNFVLAQHDVIEKYKGRFYWSEWGTWGTCSRTCDIGVQTRNRTCHDKYNYNSTISEYYCGGNKYQYKTCKLEPCVNADSDFRTYQCQVAGKKLNWYNQYEWKPYLDGGSTCRLICMAKSINIHREFADKVIDGTSCGYDFSGICVNGECLAIGCDGELNSTKTQDKCGKCGGDNLACTIISGLYPDNHAELGTTHVVTVFPKGAKNINVTEMDASNNFLALKTEKGVNIINANDHIEYSGIFKAVGTEVYYFRRRFIAYKDVGESIFIKGPINETIILQILYYQHNPGIMYHYSIEYEKPDEKVSLLKPNEKTIPSRKKYENYILIDDNKNQNDHYKKPTVYTKENVNYNIYATKQTLTGNISNQNRLPTRTYNTTRSKNPTANLNGVGSQTRPTIKILPNKLVEDNTKAIVTTKKTPLRTGSKKFASNNRRFYMQGDRNKTRRFMWFVAGLTTCSASCGGGYRQEIVKCLDRHYGKIINQSYCIDTKPEPNNFTCNAIACSPSWKVTEWSPCSSTCGTGFQNRNVNCVQKVSSLLTKELSKENCQHLPLPDLKRSCKRNCTYWKVGNWQNCQVTCGRGVKIRNVACVNELETPVEESLCSNTKPSTVEICDMGSCAKVWFYSNWSSSCEDHCESHVTRKVICGANLSQDKDAIDYETGCDINKMPEAKKACKNSHDHKCKSKWFAGPWSECSVTCNEGVRKRAVVCLVEAHKQTNKWTQKDENLCNPDEKPVSVEKCNNEPCKSEWFISEWSECSKTCDVGIRTREIKCIDENNRPSMNCDSDNRPHLKEACNQQECPQAEEVIDPKCVDKEQMCALVKRSNLCNYYRTVCCRTCR